MKTVIITGGNRGLGFECAKYIAKTKPKWTIVLACRNLNNGVIAAKDISRRAKNKNIIPMLLDLSSFESIRRFVLNIKNTSKLPKVYSLICNAGIQVISGLKYTKEGVEKTFGVNHLGHFMLVKLMLEYIDDNGKIIFVSSGTHNSDERTFMPNAKYTNALKLAYPDNIEGKKVYVGRQRYTTSKLCNILCTYKLTDYINNNLKKNITVNAFDPGMMPGTGLAREGDQLTKIIWNYVLPILKPILPVESNSPKSSGKYLANLILNKKFDNTTGKYFKKDKPINSSKDSYSNIFAEDLWETSIKLCEL